MHVLSIKKIFCQLISFRSHWARLKTAPNRNFTPLWYLFNLKSKISQWPHASQWLKFRLNINQGIFALISKYYKLWCERPPSILQKFPSCFSKFNADVLCLQIMTSSRKSVFCQLAPIKRATPNYIDSPL